MFFYYVMFLLHFIEFDNCIVYLFFYLIKITQLQFEINWNAQWKNMIFEKLSVLAKTLHTYTHIHTPFNYLMSNTYVE